MGNSTSQESRRCGLCYFPLPSGASFLSEPTVQRMRQPTWPSERYQHTALDQVLDIPKQVTIISQKTSYSSLPDSVMRGCAGCTAILAIFKAHVHQRKLVLDEKCLQHGFALHLKVNYDRRPANKMSFQIQFMGKDGDQWKQEHITLILAQATPLYMSPERMHPSALTCSRNDLSGFTGSPKSFATLKRWINQCVSSHNCSTYTTSSMPFRILKLTRSAQKGHISVRLVEGLKSSKPYACLSHRWNPSTHRCRTLRSNLAAHLIQVPWIKLPRMFQESMQAVLHLGLRYIWIDSLCIIQDDHDDWKAQAACMCDIYQGSYITVAATVANDGDKGLFVKTHPGLSVQNHASSSQKLLLRKSFPHFEDFGLSGGISPKDSYIELFPLLSRGWVFQERLLSPRIAHFSNEISFECNGSIPACECGDTMRKGGQKRYHTMALEYNKLAEIIDHWHGIISAFTDLFLTYHADRLPALAGVARQYGTAHSARLGPYVAGAWEHTLAEDLMWYASNSSGKERPSPCSAPTWSWASTSAHAGVLRFGRVQGDLEIQSFDVVLAGPDEYGPIQSAELVVRGYLAKGYLMGGGWSNTNLKRFKWAVYSASGSSSYDFDADYDLTASAGQAHIPDGADVYCLKTGFVGGGCHVCFILRPLDLVQRTFERVGLLHNTNSGEVASWFAGVTPETIKLV